MQARSKFRISSFSSWGVFGLLFGTTRMWPMVRPRRKRPECERTLDFGPRHLPGTTSDGTQFNPPVVPRPFPPPSGRICWKSFSIESGAGSGRAVGSRSRLRWRATRCRCLSRTANYLPIYRLDLTTRFVAVKRWGRLYPPKRGHKLLIAPVLYDSNTPYMREPKLQFWSNLLRFSDTRCRCMSLKQLKIVLIRT